MTRGLLAIVVVIVSLLAGCASPPQQPIGISGTLLSSKAGKVGVVMTPLPVVDTQFPGAGCLLCLATASISNQSLTAEVKTWSQEDLGKLKMTVAELLTAKGMDARVIDEPLDIKSLPGASSKDANFARQDYTRLKEKYRVDKLLVMDITALGAWRNYSAYIPAGDPKAVFKGTGYLVNLNTNVLEWYMPIDVQKSSDGPWDEPPKFPGLTNAYFQAIEIGRDAFTKPFR